MAFGFPIIQEEFRPAIEQVLELCTERFGESLEAIYLAGSVAFGEAWPGASDVDCFIFLDVEADENDACWCESQAIRLAQKYPVVSEFHLNLHSVGRLRADTTWRYLLRHFAVRLHGVDVISSLEKQGIDTPAPSRETARSMIGSMEKILDETEQQGFPERIFKLPTDPFLATRKLARWFVIREGAYILIVEDAFCSFHQRDVLNQLRAVYPQWNDLFLLTERILKDPFKAAVPADKFMDQVAPFLRWAIHRIRSS